ncbi:hypothetical protein RRG08_043520 [Elysia crispata]|uniref:Uncharacterized protein n=1 Tax=Elysia crispata TaxID=231223 RepID=A0AAE1CYI3_9GAST|nr:hypothetical protein RRG08_043520 [Elysia crispata]
MIPVVVRAEKCEIFPGEASSAIQYWKSDVEPGTLLSHSMVSQSLQAEPGEYKADIIKNSGPARPAGGHECQ